MKQLLEAMNMQLTTITRALSLSQESSQSESDIETLVTDKRARDTITPLSPNSRLTPTDIKRKASSLEEDPYSANMEAILEDSSQCQ